MRWEQILGDGIGIDADKPMGGRLENMRDRVENAERERRGLIYGMPLHSSPHHSGPLLCDLVTRAKTVRAPNWRSGNAGIATRPRSASSTFLPRDTRTPRPCAPPRSRLRPTQ